MDKALLTMDDGAREDLLRQASHIVLRDDAVMLPLHRQVNIEAMTHRVRHATRMDGRLLAMEVMPAK